MKEESQSRGQLDSISGLENHAQITSQARLLGQRLPTPSQRLDELNRFVDRYDVLVETLCDAAQYGPTLKLEARYQEYRNWMMLGYQYLRVALAAYLHVEPEDATFGLSVSGRPVDAFESLFAAPDLANLAQNDDGGMISRIMRTREALNLYGDHLRRLVSTNS